MSSTVCIVLLDDLDPQGNNQSQAEVLCIFYGLLRIFNYRVFKIYSICEYLEKYRFLQGSNSRIKIGNSINTELVIVYNTVLRLCYFV